MYLSIICLLCAFAYGISRISGPNFKAINFAEKIKGQKLKRSLIRDGEVDSESSCQFECVDEERCQSHNFVTLILSLLFNKADWFHRSLS